MFLLIWPHVQNDKPEQSRGTDQRKGRGKGQKEVRERSEMLNCTMQVTKCVLQATSKRAATV